MAGELAPPRADELPAQDVVTVCCAPLRACHRESREAAYLVQGWLPTSAKGAWPLWILEIITSRLRDFHWPYGRDSGGRAPCQQVEGNRLAVEPSKPQSQPAGGRSADGSKPHYGIVWTADSAVLTNLPYRTLGSDPRGALEGEEMADSLRPGSVLPGEGYSHGAEAFEVYLAGFLAPTGARPSGHGLLFGERLFAGPAHEEEGTP